MIMKNPRKAAAQALLEVEKAKAYSNIALNTVLKNSGLNGADRTLASAIFYGTLDRKITVDYVLSRFISTPLKKVAPYTLAVMRCAVYQIMFADKIPDSAAVNEAVELIKASGESRNRGFVNAVLRNILRSGLSLPDDSSVKSLSVRYSCPEWIIEGFTDDYGTETAKVLLEESLKPAPLTVRVNTLKTDADSLKKKFSEAGISCASAGIGNALIINGGMDIASNDFYRQGLFYAEDAACQTAVSLLAPKRGGRMLDMCAAPGGKSFTAAQLMENEGEIVACDLYEQRAGLIRKGAERLGIDIIKPLCADASVYDAGLGKFDFILCDVPCSGLGVIRRKPEIKYKPETDFKELCGIQYKILQNARNYLSDGGRILYSTCTLRRDENENLVKRFLMEYNGYRKAYERTFMPHTDKTDGFYCALIVKDK